MSQEVVAGDGYRPGFGLYVGQLLSREPGLPIHVVAHDGKQARLLSQTFGILLDEIETPREAESYEQALLRLAEEYRSDQRNPILVHTRSLTEAIPTMVVPAEPEAWLLQLQEFFRLLGVFLPTEGLGFSFYQAAAQASEALAGMV